MSNNNHPQYIRPLYIPLTVILISNILGALHILPVFPQLLLNSSAVVFLGCIAGTQVLATTKGYKAVVGDSGDE